MKSIVVYYSQTGNTKKIAHAIHRGLKKASQTGDQYDIARLKDVSPRDMVNYDLIGIGSPIMELREPLNVTEFIDGMKPVDGKHAFVFNTHGCLPSWYMANVVPRLIQRGLTVIGWNDWFGSVVYPFIMKPYLTDGHPDAIDLEEAEHFGAEMVERSRRIYKGETQLIPKLPTGKAYDEIYNPVPMEPTPEYLAFLKAVPRVAKVNREKCKYPKCTHCIDNCPTGCIDFSSGEFSIRFDSKRCITCYLCEQTCPNGAIEVDYTEGTPLHDVGVKTLFLPILEHMEKQGRFRRLVPLKDIKYEDNRPWKLKHPHFKIDY
ncbi:MAG: 4Fe-4S dicluster domain-containing protein [Dehalococcoidales bacterium]|nr:4Fe-4S dicluster domain-containing protein [Dehalococcoidales bacterium]